QGVLVSTGQQTANVQVVPINSAGNIVSTANVGVVAIQLEAAGSATVSVNPSDLFADGLAHTSSVTISNLKDANGVNLIPDGARVGLSVSNSATFIGCCFISSAGGQILSVGTTADDGTPVSGNP